MTGSLYGSTEPAAVQREQFRAGEIPVAVYGLGKMGLPLAAVYAEHTGNVTGVDVDESVVERVNAGESPVQGEPGLDPLVASLVDEGALRATTDATNAARDASIHVVVVPTLVDEARRPDLSAVEAVAEEVATGLEPGDLVVLESTMPPGATADVVSPILVEGSDCAAWSFGVAVCPERTSSGRALEDVRGTHPKVVGGTDEESGRVAELMYGELVDNEIVRVDDATTAEAVKVFEGLYRDVNIALANDLARLTDALGVDVRAAIEAANTQPYCDIHTPGPGVGGHCIPYYPYFVLGWLDRDVPTLSTARGVNDAMPRFVVDRVAEGLAAWGPDEATPPEGASTADGPTALADGPPNNVPDRLSDGPSDAPSEAPGNPPADAVPDRPTDSLDQSTVAVLGLTYRAGVRETRASPGIDICEELADRGATVLAADPLVDADSVSATDVTVGELPSRAPDAAVLATAHEAFDAVDWGAMPPAVVIDGRDVLDLSDTQHRQYTVGRGWS